jgi:hypothetical protein
MIVILTFREAVEESFVAAGCDASHVCIANRGGLYGKRTVMRAPQPPLPEAMFRAPP